MAHIGSCTICGAQTLDDTTCRDCKDEVMRRVLAGEEISLTSIKAAVEKKRLVDIEEELARTIKEMNQRCPTCGKRWEI